MSQAKGFPVVYFLTDLLSNITFLSVCCAVKILQEFRIVSMVLKQDYN